MAEAQLKRKIEGPDKDLLKEDNAQVQLLQGEEPQQVRESTKKRKYVKKMFEPQFEWEKEYLKYFEHILTKSNAKKAVSLLRTLSAKDHFFIQREQTLKYKNKNLGNIFLLMYFLFNNDKAENKMAKRTLELKKALATENIKM